MAENTEYWQKKYFESTKIGICGILLSSSLGIIGSIILSKQAYEQGKENAQVSKHADAFVKNNSNHVKLHKRKPD